MEKPELYRDLARQLAALLAGEPDPIANAANTAALIYHGLPNLNWAGFYFRNGAQLVLGPFQGKPACVRIPMGKGVCGTAAARGTTVLVPDVLDFPGHIACDPDSRSELVIPLTENGGVLGVLDLDSPLLARFDELDRAGCEQLVALLLVHHRNSTGRSGRDPDDPHGFGDRTRSAGGGGQMKTLVDDAEHWRSRAEETRTIAEIMTDLEAKRIMFDIAEGYDRLAERAVERTGNRDRKLLQ